MNGRNAKLARKAANDAARQTGEAAGNVAGMILEYARKIEVKADGLEAAVSALEDWRARTFAGRVKWLLTGR